MADATEGARILVEDFAVFCRTVVYIRQKDGSVVLLDPNADQQELIDTIAHLERTGQPVRLVILKARQLGFSTIVQAYLLWKALLFPGSQCLTVAHNEEASSELFGKIELAYDLLPDEMRAAYDSIRDSRKQGKKLAWKQPIGSTLYVDHAGNKNLGRSQTFQFAHLSELAFWDKPEGTMLGLMQSIPEKPGTSIIIESTANGMGNYFHKTWKSANDPNSGSVWKPLFFPWHSDPGYARSKRPGDKNLTPQELELKKRYELSDEQIYWRRDKIAALNGDEDRFNQENPGSPEDAFLVSGRPYFGRPALFYYGAKVDSPGVTGDWDTLTHKFIPDATPHDGSPYWIWEKPTKNGVYVVSADVSEGSAADYSALHVLDAKNLRVVASGKIKRDPDEFAWDIWRFACVYNDALVAPEKNGVGYTVLSTLLKRCEYPNVFTHLWDDKLNPGSPTDYGWKTTPKSRPIMLANLAAVTRTMELVMPCSRTLEDMKSFVRDGKDRPQAADGEHDDMVMSLAIAVSVRDVAVQRGGWSEPSSYYNEATASMTGY